MSTTTTVKPLLSFYVQGKPCSANRMYNVGKRGNHYLSDQAQTWRHLVWVAAVMELNAQWQHAPHFEHRPTVRVVCTFYRVRGDADNYLKATLDGLKSALNLDDRHFNPVESHVSDDKSQPQGACIEVYAATPEQGAA